jgi:hypothetical protein
MNYIIKRYSILSLLLLLCGVVGQAQTLVFEQSFTEFDKIEELSSTDPDFPGWTFTNCFKHKTNCIRVGSNSVSGSITTPFFNLSGNALIALRVKKSESVNSITFTISSTSGVLRQTSFTTDSNVMFGLPVYLNNGGANTQITISSTANNHVYIESIRVYDLGDAIFYESFDAIEGGAGNEFTPTDYYADSLNCDNSDGSVFNNIQRARHNIYFKSPSPSYSMPTILVNADSDYLLSFRVSKFGDFACNLSIDYSDAKGTPFNSNDFSNMSSSQLISLNDEPVNTWQDYYTVITGMTSSTVLTFGGYSINLDNILLTPIPTLLDEAANNITYIKGHAGQTTDVELRRTLTANVWCPLCLPFDVTPESFATAANAVVADANPVLRTFKCVSEGVFTFDVVPAATTIAAGTPFLVKVTKQVTNPTFAGVTVVNTPAVAVPANSDYQFVGTYSPVNLNTDGTHLFLGTDGKLYKPGTTAGYNHMNGLRAYFQIPAAALGTRISLPGDETTAIQDINDDGYQYEHRFDSEAVRTQNLLPRQITIREGRKYLSK